MGQYISYLIIYSIITEILSVILVLLSAYMLVGLGPIWAYISYYVISMLFGAYLAMFKDRFRGLIYSAAIER